jgi:hypothetical protein
MHREPRLPPLVRTKLLPAAKSICNLERDTYDEYNGVTLTYPEKLKMVASQVLLWLSLLASQCKCNDLERLKAQWQALAGTSKYLQLHTAAAADCESLLQVRRSNAT